MSRSAQRPSPAPRKKLETPLVSATVVCVALSVLGAFIGFETLGSLGPVPVLLLLIIVIFVVGATMTVRRIMALRSPAPSSSKD